MPELLSLESATAARAAAWAAHESVLAEIQTAEAQLAANTPAAVVSAGGNLADASRAKTEAEHRLEFLHKAKDESWRIVLEADATLNFANVHAQWGDKLNAAIAARIAAIQAREAALAARAKAEADYTAATLIIAAAHSHGMPKPARLHEYPLFLPQTIDHSLKMQMRSVDEEKWLWGVA